MHPGDCSDRDMCYSRSISNIKQTVSDMQKLYFDEYPDITYETSRTYRTLTEIRPWIM